MKFLATAALAVLLAACSAEAPAPSAEPPAKAAPAPADANAITSEGWGPLRIGMTRAEITAALGPDANPNSVGGADPEACDQFRPERAPENMLLMLERGVLTRITLQEGSTLRTDRGFGVGASATEIKSAYGASAIVAPHRYIGLPAEYITVWTAHGAPNAETYVENPAARGIRYETNAEGVVTLIHAGAPSIQLVEGCS